MAGAATLALAVLAAKQGATHDMHALPNWCLLSGGATSPGWFARTVQLLAVVPVLLATVACQPALHPVVSRV